MSSTPSIIIGADIGNATCTVISATSERVFFEPSWYSAFPSESFPNDSRHHVLVNVPKERTFVIGESAGDEMGSTSLLSGLPESKAYMRYTTPQSLAFLLAGIAHVHPKIRKANVALYTGVPKSVEHQRSGIAAFLSGIKSFQYRGEDREYTIGPVHVSVEGEYMLKLLDESQRKLRIAGWDIGGRTIHLHLFKDGVHKHTLPLDAGVERLLDRSNDVPSDHRTRWEDRAKILDPMSSVGQLLAGHPNKKSNGGSLHSVIAIAQEKTAIASADLHVCIGGGAHLLAYALAYHYGQNVLVVDNPSTANARSYIEGRV